MGKEVGHAIISGMFNYSNLSDYDFEQLAKDVMERKLGLKLRMFGKGKDGGIDICDVRTGNEILIQVKHYSNSSPANLLRSLKDEVKKVQKINPEQYYVFTSCSLTPQRVSEIQELFEGYMMTTENIVTATEINDFLEKQCNQDILGKHFKLWLTSTNILDLKLNRDIWVDSQDLMQKIKDDSKLYVETDCFRRAYDILLEEKILLLLGPPGIGKTTTSEMLVAKFAAQGYRVKYVSNSLDLSGLKKSLDLDNKSKEIILLDDCFGQCYFRMHDNQDKEMVSLIRTVQLSSNKILLLNSRITIYNEAIDCGAELAKTIDNGKIKIARLELKTLSQLEKAQILYNHLYFQGFPEPYWKVVRNQENYLKIIRHRNFTPRIIEFVTRRAVVKCVGPDKYIDYIKTQLDNPEQIWRNEFEQRLGELDRLLLTTLYSLTENHIEEDILKSCYIKRLQHRDICTSINQYDNSMRRLSEAFLVRLDKDGEPFVRVFSPSVNDFLRNYFLSNQAEVDELKQTINCANQVVRLYGEHDGIVGWKENSELKRRLEAGDAINWIYPTSIGANILATMVGYFGVRRNEYVNAVKDFLENPTSVLMGGLLFSAEDALIGLSNGDMVDFYGLTGIWGDCERLSSILSGIQLPYVVKILNNIEKLFRVAQKRKRFLSCAFDCLEEESDEFLLFPNEQATRYGGIVNDARQHLMDLGDDIDDVHELEQEVLDMMLNNMQDEHQQIIDGLHGDMYEYFVEETSAYPDREMYEEYARELVEDFLKQDEVYEAKKDEDVEMELAVIRQMFSV